MSNVKIANPAYRIETKRLVIRCYNPSDAKLLADSVSESVEHLKPWMPWAHDEPQRLESREELLRSFRGKFDLQQDFIYGIFNRDETRLLGGTGLHTRLGDKELEIGYWIHKDFINQGLVTESTAALIKVAFEIIHIHRIEIHCDTRNLASAAVPRKLGFTHEGTLRAKTPFLDHWSDSMIWGLLESEYPNSPSVKAVIRAFDAVGNALL
ncbi:MAG: putative ribosomal N-acetyltransferase YdaF [Anaerolineales bacterium]|nr:putative ribosomal N-acetyltransferase YdaF [Anaerolineales bacterium]